MSRESIKPMETSNILGANIAVTNMKDTVSWICENIEMMSNEYLCISNVHTTVMSHEDEVYREIQNSAIAALPDGMPLSIIQRGKGFKNAERVAGYDLMLAIYEISVRRGYRHFFYGSTERTLKLLKERLEKNYPGIIVAGTYVPPFGKISVEEDNRVVDDINTAKADFIWVGLGAPKQEEWMASHKGRVKGLMVGVGAGFDYLAGNLKRAPLWMQRSSMEWLYRLIQEPRRLFKRYVVTNSKFIWFLLFDRKDK